jgi:hypothetical protein
VLAELLAERELRGSRVPVLTLLLRGREDARWIERAVPWLRLRGRRVIVRTRVVIPRSLVSVLAEAHRVGPGTAIVELEVAHIKPAVHRALLPTTTPSGTGPGASAGETEPADMLAALLLQAQHLETLGIPVVARLAPLLPGIHDQANGFTPLLRNLVGADVRDLVLEAGHLHPAQLRGLVAAQREIGVAGLLELARAYTVDPMIVLGGIPVPADAPVYKLKPRRAQVFTHGLEQVAREHDGGALRLPSCGCRAHCALAAPRSLANLVGGLAGTRLGDRTIEQGRPYEAVMGRDLFATP